MNEYEVRRRFAFIETRRNAASGITLPMACGAAPSACVRGGTCSEHKADSGKAKGYCAHCWQERMTTKLHARAGRERPGVEDVRVEIRHRRDMIASIRDAGLFAEDGSLIEPELEIPEVAAVFGKER